MRLFGKNSVIERLRTNPASIRKVYLEEGYPDKGYIYKKAKPYNIPIHITTAGRLSKTAHHKNTQGILADAEDFSYTPYEDLLEVSLKQNRTPVFLDELNDPQNLGAIIRSLACLGRFALVLPTHKSVDITEVVLRIASGGDCHLPIAKVSNINAAIRSAKTSGFSIVGTVVKGGKSLQETHFSFPIGLVIGSEQKGIREVVRANLDVEVTIPMARDTLSFNVAHATTIFAYEITRQKDQNKKYKS